MWCVDDWWRWCGVWMTGGGGVMCGWLVEVMCV